MAVIGVKIILLLARSLNVAHFPVPHRLEMPLDKSGTWWCNSHDGGPPVADWWRKEKSIRIRRGNRNRAYSTRPDCSGRYSVDHRKPNPAASFDPHRRAREDSHCCRLRTKPWPG